MTPSVLYSILFGTSIGLSVAASSWLLYVSLIRPWWLNRQYRKKIRSLLGDTKTFHPMPHTVGEVTATRVDCMAGVALMLSMFLLIGALFVKATHSHEAWHKPINIELKLN